MEAYVFYSHYEYSDIWPLMFGQSDKFLANKKKYLITNKVGEYENKEWEFILYDDTRPYQERVYNSLEKIKEDILIFHHEDMFLLSEPKWEIISVLVDKVRSGEIDLIKLIRASYDNQFHASKDKNLYYNPKNLLFSIQPTIVKKENIIEIYKQTSGNSIWEFENNSNNLVQSLNYSSCYYCEGNERKRGMFHWDSNVYPYIATAIVKGKWDFECYSEELTKILDEYKIDPTVRGKNA